MASKRTHGISVLLPTQNAEKTVELSIRSFVDFADEIIAVDNGSTDATASIVRGLEKKIDILTFYDVPELPDLYHNRQYAFERSHHSWICRFDSDYIAYTSGPYAIRKLREKILGMPRPRWPVAFGFKNIVSLTHDFYHTGIIQKSDPRVTRSGVHPPHVPVITQAYHRIYQYVPGMRFVRLGRWEGVNYQLCMRHILLNEPPLFHCSIRSPLAHFYRTERTNWREHGDFKRFPTLDSYIRSVIKEKYNTDDITEACRIYMEQDFYPYLVPYDPNKYFPYPQLIEEQIRREPTP